MCVNSVSIYTKKKIHVKYKITVFELILKMINVSYIVIGLS